MYVSWNIRDIENWKERIKFQILLRYLHLLIHFILLTVINVSKKWENESKCYSLIIHSDDLIVIDSDNTDIDMNNQFFHHYKSVDMFEYR